MSRLTKASLIDPLIRGTIEPNLIRCGTCIQDVTGIKVSSITLPQGIEPSTRIIGYRASQNVTPGENKPVVNRYLGIGCGCYARFHRQIAHIEDRRKK